MKVVSAFPLDDTDYLAEDLRKWFYTRTTGVYSVEGNLAVKGNNNMSVTVDPGIAFMNDGVGGIVAWSDYSVTLEVPIADNMLDRIDSVVFRWDKKQNNTVIDLVPGDLAEHAVPKAPVRDSNCYEIVLAHIDVSMGTGAVTEDKVSDTRMDDKICGLMRDGITSIPTQDLYDQFKTWVDSLKDVLDESTAGNLLSMINALDSNKSDKDHTHDDRYYLKADVDQKLTGKSNTSHTHDDRYFTETECNRYFINKDTEIAVVNGTATFNNTDRPEINISYPSGFNKNCVVISMMGRNSNQNYYSAGIYPSSSGYGTGGIYIETMLTDNGIKIVLANPVGGSQLVSGTSTFYIRVVLMKITLG